MKYIQVSYTVPWRHTQTAMGPTYLWNLQGTCPLLPFRLLGRHHCHRDVDRSTQQISVCNGTGKWMGKVTFSACFTDGLPCLFPQIPEHEEPGNIPGSDDDVGNCPVAVDGPWPRGSNNGSRGGPSTYLTSASLLIGMGLRLSSATLSGVSTMRRVSVGTN